MEFGRYSGSAKDNAIFMERHICKQSTLSRLAVASLQGDPVAVARLITGRPDDEDDPQDQTCAGKEAGDQSAAHGDLRWAFGGILVLANDDLRSDGAAALADAEHQGEHTCDGPSEVPMPWRAGQEDVQKDRGGSVLLLCPAWRTGRQGEVSVVADAHVGPRIT